MCARCAAYGARRCVRSRGCMRNCARVCDAPSCVSGQEELHANHDTYQIEKNVGKGPAERASPCFPRRRRRDRLHHRLHHAKDLSYDDRNLGINNQLRTLGNILSSSRQLNECGLHPPPSDICRARRNCHGRFANGAQSRHANLPAVSVRSLLHLPPEDDALLMDEEPRWPTQPSCSSVTMTGLETPIRVAVRAARRCACRTPVCEQHSETGSARTCRMRGLCGRISSHRSDRSYPSARACRCVSRRAWRSIRCA